MSLENTPSRQQQDAAVIIDLALDRMRTGAVVKEHRALWVRRSLAAIAIIGALVLVGTRDFVYQSPDSTVTDEGVTTVTLKQDRQGHYFAMGRINGDSVKFLLDTGATTVAIPASVAKRLKLPYGARRQYSTANGIAFGYETTLRSVSLGDIKKHRIAASITPGMSGEQILLGMSFLKSLDIRQSGGKMEISVP